MSKGRGGTNVKFGAKIRPRSIVVLEAFPSAEICSYDYEAALSQPDLPEFNAGDNEDNAKSAKDNEPEKNHTTATDPTKECLPRAVCFATDTPIPEILKSVTELVTEGSHSPQQLLQKESASCKTIVNEAGEASKKSANDSNPVAGSKSKEFAKTSVTLAADEVKNREPVDTSACSEKVNEISPKQKCSVKSLTRKKIISPSLQGGKKHSRIPRATTNARIPSRRNSKTSLGGRSFFSNRSKPVQSFVDSNRAPVLWKSDLLRPNKESTQAITDLKEVKPNSGTSLSKEECADVKITAPQLSKECSRTKLGNASDKPLVPSNTSVGRNLRLANPCRSCNDQRETVNLQLSIHDVQDSWSDSKSSPEIRSPDPWLKTLNMRPYVESTSEEVDLSSEYSSDSVRPTKMKCFLPKPSSKSPILKSGHTRNSPRPRPRRRARFSFLHTLFDIVFWPFLFLRTNR